MVIKAAYRWLAHINQAYSVLSDPTQRQRYDQAHALNTGAPERRGQSGGPAKNQQPAPGPAASRAFVFRPLA